MDNLDNLPLKDDTDPNTREEEIMNKYFAQTGRKSQPRAPHGNPRAPDGDVASDVSDSEGKGVNWKVVGYTTALFLALANPWIDVILCKIPYCEDNTFILLGIKTLVFAILYVIMSIFFG